MKKKFRGQNFIISTGVGLLFSLPVTGFVYGFFACIDCGNGILGFFGRVFTGIVGAFLTIITLGKPWNNEGGTSNTNLRLYALLTFIIITLLIFLILNRLQKTKSQRNDNIQR